MQLRFLQIFLPEDADADVDNLLEGRDVLSTWRDGGAEARQVVNLIVPAEAAEPIMDRFEQEFAQADGFRMVLFPVEAVVPRPELATEERSGDEESKEREKKTSEGTGRVSREELYADITESLGVNRVFVAMTVLSAIVAAAGLLRDDVVVIIGAMVIAPLLAPNVAMSLSTTLGDVDLLRHSLFTNVIGVTSALVVSIGIGLIFTIDPEIPAIASRTSIGASDLALALAAGSAGTFAYTRGLSGAVIGVMVAVALVPPLVVFGMLLGAGYLLPASGALLLVAANVVCINLAGVATFLAQGVRPRTWWEEKRAKKASRIAMLTWLLLLIALVIIVYVTQVSASAAS